MILKVISANSVDPDQIAPWSSLIRIHTVCLYAKIGLKSLQEYSADDIKQTTFSDAGFLGILRVNTKHALGKFSRWQIDIMSFILQGLGHIDLVLISLASALVLALA